VRIVASILILLLCACTTLAQDNSPVQGNGFSPNQWIEENIDPDVLKVLKQLDQDKVDQLFVELRAAMAGTNIYKLATLHETAKQLVPVLAKFEETAPYAAWLQARLDYLEAAGRLELAMKAERPPGANASVLPLAPSLKLQRRVWAEELRQRPWPKLAQAYAPKLKQIFIAEKVPPELVWLAEVESSFDPRARSPAGAAGLFQLTAQTAKAQKLSLWPWDERLQPEKCAAAAARYLRELHKHFGDWQLALAAYNCGEGRVDKLLKQAKFRSFDAIARRLPVETQMYVPKIEATIEKREGRLLEGLKTPKS
jgi:membrane-bound lytic murein transglycosylase D